MVTVNGSRTLSVEELINLLSQEDPGSPVEVAIQTSPHREPDLFAFIHDVEQVFDHGLEIAELQARTW